MRPERRADLNPVPRLRMYVAVYPFPHVSSCCAQGNLYLYYIPVYGVIYTGVNHHHHISFMELGHLLTRSGLTYPEVSSKVYHDYFCQLVSSISLHWVIYFEVFYLHAVSSFSYIPVICPKLVLF